MVAAVREHDPHFIARVGVEPIAAATSPRRRCRGRAPAPRVCWPDFDRRMGGPDGEAGRRLAGSEEVIADARARRVRTHRRRTEHRRSIDRVLHPAQNRYRLESLTCRITRR